VSDEKIDTGSQNVTGYRPQTPDALDTVNTIKRSEVDIARLWRWVRARPDVPTDPRQLALARTAFEEAFMHLNRAVFQPIDPFADEA
jgi:hypothetical protein